MVKKSWVVLFMLMSSSLAAAQGTSSRDYWKKWEFSLFGGFGGLGGENSFLSPVADGSTKNVRVNSASGYVIGARVSESLGRNFGAELEYSLNNIPATFANLLTNGSSFSLDQRTHNLTYNVQYFPLDRGHRLRPFGTFGMGASLFSVDSESQDQAVLAGADLRNRWKLAATYGAGVKFASSERWGVRFDFRDHISGVPDYGLPRESPLLNGVAGAGFRPEGVFHNWQFTTGFTYSFEGR